MKKSKSSSSAKRKERSRSPSDDSRSKRVKTRSKSKEKEKIKDESKSGPRKTRWQAADSESVAKSAAVAEKSGPPLRIRDLLHDKEKIVDLLFQTVTGAALEELIPDYLKTRSKEDLTKLCLEQIKDMTDEEILAIISGKVDSSNKDEEKNVEKEQILKLEQPTGNKNAGDGRQKRRVKESPVEEKEEKVEVIETKKEAQVVGPSTGVPESSCNEDVERSEEENVIPLVIKDEIAKDLILPERDAELLELEMRARAIRSLLKSKTQSTAEEEVKD